MNYYVYTEESAKKCDNIAQSKASNVHVTLCRGLSLQDYSKVRKTDCHSRHLQPCLGCGAMLSVAHRVITEGRLAFPHQVYKTDTARQRFLQMPVAYICVGTPGSGKEAWYLIKYMEGVDYVNFAHFAEALFGAHKLSQSPGINKSEINALLGLAQTGRGSLSDTL